MKGKKIYTFNDREFFNPLINEAEKIEKKRFVDLYNHYHKDKKNLTEAELVGGLNELGYEWQRMYVDILDGINPIDININTNELAEEWFDVASDLMLDICKQELVVERAKYELANAASGSNVVKMTRDLGDQTKFYNGLKREEERLLHRFKQMKNLDYKTTFKESQGDWSLELYGDFKWKFPGSKVNHWSEVKTALDNFHITGSGSKSFLYSLITNSKIEKRKNTLVIVFSQEGVDKAAQHLLLRKFKSTGAYPVYEDGNMTILSSEMLRYFQLDGVDVYVNPYPILPEESDVKAHNTENKEELENLVRTTFQKKDLHADLWYASK